ncbi:hypothetical protein PN36_15540 [Candidatus Thiomargarita nelsonii]|uniref:Uncharacterized protein n=1 Tax=Candidatus Thiomargarita nelsonii TaxID=1003181 RepID=A0A0A6P5V8_9GAMM|nr:hypothetical protein PN36_15540 [Candidatus Thiomargarita nelsonii]
MRIAGSALCQTIGNSGLESKIYLGLVFFELIPKIFKIKLWLKSNFKELSMIYHFLAEQTEAGLDFDINLDKDKRVYCLLVTTR